MEQEKKTIFCFVGRSNAGKDTLANMFSKEYNIPILCSYTDRPMRPTEQQGIQHHFVVKKEMDRLLKREEILAFTHIKDKYGNGYRYCTTVKQVQEIVGNQLIYIIDPTGLLELREKYSDVFNIVVIHVLAQENVRRMRSIARGDLNFDKRNEDENEQFSKFESDLKNADVTILNDTNADLTYQTLVQYLKDFL